MPRTQPDFKALFFDTFSRQVSGVSYKVRSDSNFQHDAHFLRSLLNESRFQLRDIKHNKKTLEIPLMRARWELRDEVEKRNLVEIPSLLKFSRVKKIKWCATDITHSSPFEGNLIEDGDKIDGETRCEIDNLFIGESTRDDATVQIVIKGYPGYWSPRVFMSCDGFVITLKDGKQNVSI